MLDSRDGNSPEKAVNDEGDQAADGTANGVRRKMPCRQAMVGSGRLTSHVLRLFAIRQWSR